MLYAFPITALFLPFVAAVPILDRRAGGSRTTPPAGCLVVEQGTSTSGYYTTIEDAIDSLSGSADACIFVYPGTYTLTEQILIDYEGALTLYGSTTDVGTYAENTVTVQWSMTSTEAGSDSLSAAIQVTSDNFSMYNINVKNTYGAGTQAIAFTAHGNQHGYYGCGFYGYQDTLYAYAGDQYYKNCYIEGAVDYIFGDAAAWFESCILASDGPGAITANSREETTDTAWYVINNSTITAVSGDDLYQEVYLGRPWRDYARVIFQYSSLSDIINPKGWTTLDLTAIPTFEEYENTGAGSDTSERVNETVATAAVTMAQLWPDGYSWINATY
ncbi:family 8 carbohydrate esterase [Cryphonectria parasitica EP155]|uniref:Pectinesterase n=1 Tax=Cryphonectria parasitica (strain ATCC 38755 / EP155) TaxID=660469 RepID=A0A9P5CMQ1_CRYP1|nr:family 8 carbohydrate esterase [Cryphonectria parasitica EP155]KAF3763311.1 family 8 carbohydrate esterase [Cryphonectria parasitica EP155]